MCTLRLLVALVAASVCIRAFALEPDQVYAKVAPSIVVVWGYRSSAPNDISFGSGVIIAPGQIVTNCHVVEGADVIYLHRATVKTLGIVRYADPDRDLCQIGATDIKGFERAVSHILTTDALRVGQKVYAIGAPQGLELTLSDGLISSLRALPIGTIIQTNAPVSKGSSGGGLFDTNGRLIGITSFNFRSGQNLNFAVPAPWISELAVRHKIREEARREEVEAQAKADDAHRLADEAKREEEHKQRAAVVERERQQQEAVRKKREAEEARERAYAASPGGRQERTINDYKARIQARIKNRIVVPPNMNGNPEARFEVVLLPGGEVFSATLSKSSGNQAYDAEIQRAIMAAQPFSVPSDTDLFHENFRDLILVFRPKDLEAPSAAETISPKAIAEPQVEPSVAAPTSFSATDQAAIQRTYDNAYSNYRLSDYPSAIRSFDGFLKSYPKHPLAPNAQYWIGESYSHLRQYREAIEAERRLLGTYPESARASDALLIIGTAESNLGDNPAARKTFEELIAKYPGSESAEKAKGRLATLK